MLIAAFTMIEKKDNPFIVKAFFIFYFCLSYLFSFAIIFLDKDLYFWRSRALVGVLDFGDSEPYWKKDCLF